MSESIFQEAESYDGFVARIHSPEGTPRPNFIKAENVDTPTTLTVWRNIQCAMQFVYHSSHNKVFKLGNQWFVEPDWPNYALWWTEAGHLPDREIATEKIELLHEEGAGPSVFDFKSPYDPKGKRLAVGVLKKEF